MTKRGCLLNALSGATGAMIALGGVVAWKYLLLLSDIREAQALLEAFGDSMQHTVDLAQGKARDADAPNVRPG